MAGAVLPAVPCATKVSHRNAPGAISAIAFIVKPVRPRVAFISGADFSGTESSPSEALGSAADWGHHCRDGGVPVSTNIASLKPKGKCKILIREIR
jgi:hypothetical protein